MIPCVEGYLLVTLSSSCEKFLPSVFPSKARTVFPNSCFLAHNVLQIFAKNSNVTLDASKFD